MPYLHTLLPTEETRRRGGDGEKAKGKRKKGEERTSEKGEETQRLREEDENNGRRGEIGSVKEGGRR